MPLNKVALKNGIKTLMTDMRTREANSDEEFSDRLANLIEDYVKSGDGKITTATMVAGSTPVTGTATVTVKMQ